MEAETSGRPTDTGAACPDTWSGLLTMKELAALLWPPLTLEGSTRDLSVDPAHHQWSLSPSHHVLLTYQGAAVELVRAVTVPGAGGAPSKLLLDAREVGLGRVHVISLLLILTKKIK